MHQYVSVYPTAGNVRCDKRAGSQHSRRKGVRSSLHCGIRKCVDKTCGFSSQPLSSGCSTASHRHSSGRHNFLLCARAGAGQGTFCSPSHLLHQQTRSGRAPAIGKPMARVCGMPRHHSLALLPSPGHCSKYSILLLPEQVLVTLKIVLIPLPPIQPPAQCPLAKWSRPCEEAFEEAFREFRSGYVLSIPILTSRAIPSSTLNPIPWFHNDRHREAARQPASWRKAWSIALWQTAPSATLDIWCCHPSYSKKVSHGPFCQGHIQN